MASKSSMTCPKSRSRHAASSCLKILSLVSLNSHSDLKCPGPWWGLWVEGQGWPEVMPELRDSTSCTEPGVHLRQRRAQRGLGRKGGPGWRNTQNASLRRQVSGRTRQDESPSQPCGAGTFGQTKGTFLFEE